LLVIAVCNGYFGAGGGVLLLAGLAAVMPGDVRRVNLFKVLVLATANASATSYSSPRRSTGASPR
jgi:hypothetical protein